MSIPTIILGILISTLYGTGFHLWRGGQLGRLFLYIFLGWIGFWGGEWLANRLNLTFASVGSLHLGVATLASFALLLLGYWLSLVEVQKK